MKTPSAELRTRLAAARRVGLFGGSFDPPHRGHLYLAQVALQARDLDHVLFIPAARPPHKPDRRLASAADRCAMLELLCASERNFSVWRGELDRSGPSYSIDTARELRAELQAAELFWILGSDNLQDLPSWREVEEFLRLVSPLVIYRRGEELDVDLLPGLSAGARERIRRGCLQVPPVDASSTQVRAELARGGDVGAWIPADIEEYIRSRGIYQP